MNDQKLHKFEKNEICSMEYGINMNLVKFYEVTRRTDHYVWFERIDETFEHDGHGQEGWKLPFPSSSRRSKEFRLKIYISKRNGDEEAHMKYQGLIEKWNGKPIYYNSMD
jgi:hypothetical protein